MYVSNEWVIVNSPQERCNSLSLIDTVLNPVWICQTKIGYDFILAIIKKVCKDINDRLGKRKAIESMPEKVKIYWVIGFTHVLR